MTPVKKAADALTLAAFGPSWIKPIWPVEQAFAPDAAEAYNGQPGGSWDAHMDMCLATVGAALVARPRREVRAGAR